MNDQTTVEEDPKIPKPLSDEELLDWYTHRIQTVVQEQIEEGFRPMTEKALVLGILVGAKALCQIAKQIDSLESAVKKIERRGDPLSLLKPR